MTSGYFANGGMPDEVDTEGGITLNGATDGKLLLQRTTWSNELDESERIGQAHNGTHVSLARAEIAMMDLDNPTNGGLTSHSGEPRLLVFTSYNGLATKTHDQDLFQGRFRMVGITKGADIYGQDAKLQSGVALDIAGKRTMQYNALKPCQAFDFLRVKVPSVDPSKRKRMEDRLADQRGPSQQSHGKYLVHLEPYVLGGDDGSVRDVTARAIRRQNINSGMMLDSNVASGGTEAGAMDRGRGDTRRLLRANLDDTGSAEHAGLSLAQYGQFMMLSGMRGLIHAAVRREDVDAAPAYAMVLSLMRADLGVVGSGPGAAEVDRKTVQDNMRYVFRHQTDGALAEDDIVHRDANHNGEWAETHAEGVISAAASAATDDNATRVLNMAAEKTPIEQEMHTSAHTDHFEAQLSFKAELEKDVQMIALTETECGGSVDVLLLR
jgi:hypothetical protein